MSHPNRTDIAAFLPLTQKFHRKARQKSHKKLQCQLAFRDFGESVLHARAQKRRQQRRARGQ